MKSKISILTVVFFSLFITANAFKSFPANTKVVPTASNISSLVNMTPKEIYKMTGKKLTLKEVIKLKAAQKYLKSQKKSGDDGISKGLYILLSLIGATWIFMGIQDDWSGSTWIVNLLLFALCWLPGFIHSMVKMKDYTK